MSTTMTDWDPPNGGHWRRDFRLAEWLSAPLTPSFATWILPRVEDGFAEAAAADWGFKMEQPMHVIVNGWYFTTDPKTSGMASALRRHPRRMIGTAVAMATMGTRPERVARWMAEPARRVYLDTLLPAHRARIADAAAAIEQASPGRLMGIVDELAWSTGTLMLPMVQALGFAGKAEFALATFHTKHLRDRVDSPHLDLLVGLVIPAPPPPHGVYSLDWIEPTVGEAGSHRPAADASDHGRAHTMLEARRLDAEAACRVALADDAKLCSRFDELLRLAQDAIPVRESMVSEFTEAWPVLRRAGVRLGDVLTRSGVLPSPADIWYLERDEIRAAIDGASSDLRDTAARRRTRRHDQGRLAPPLGIGTPSGPWRHLERFLRVFQTPTSTTFAIRGIGTSSGVATGTVRVLRGIDDFATLRDGDVLVAPITTPAWTPLFCVAAAVVTDGGSPFAHAAVVAREYGIPAVVGTGDATTRLHDGQVVTVDGAAGTVTINS